MMNEIGKIVFSRGMLENVYPIYASDNIPFRGVRINGKRPLAYRIEKMSKAKRDEKFFLLVERHAKAALDKDAVKEV